MGSTPSSLALAQALHPTAAVAGTPTADACALIGDAELAAPVYEQLLPFEGQNTVVGCQPYEVLAEAAERAGARLRSIAG